MKIATPIVVGAFIGVITADFYSAHKRYVALHRVINPALSPGRICDDVAAERERHPTVAWYHACINYAAEVQARYAASVDTRPEGGDGTKIAAPFTGGAVPKADAQ